MNEKQKVTASGKASKLQNASAAEPGQITAAVVQERIHVDKLKREIGTSRVKILPRVRKTDVKVDLTDETVEIERVPINRIVDKPEAIRQEGDTTIIPVFEEILVVEKKLVLKEEVRITRRHSTRHETRQVPVRSEEVQITRTSNTNRR